MRGGGAPSGATKCRPFRVRLPPLRVRRALWRRALRLPALLRGVLTTAPGRAFGFPSLPPPRRARHPRKDGTGAEAGLGTSRPSASSWQGAVLPPGGAPTPPGSLLARQTRGRRTGRRPGIARCRPPGSDAVSPAPFPGSSRLATPREAPLSGRGSRNIVRSRNLVKRAEMAQSGLGTQVNNATQTGRVCPARLFDCEPIVQGTARHASLCRSCSTLDICNAATPPPHPHFAVIPEARAKRRLSGTYFSSGKVSRWVRPRATLRVAWPGRQRECRLDTT
jgi:hypothetical protein